jgi:hypothetical protein
MVIVLGKALISSTIDSRQETRARNSRDQDRQIWETTVKTSRAPAAKILVLCLAAMGADAHAASPIFSSRALVAQIAADPLDGSGGSQGDTTV